MRSGFSAKTGVGRGAGARAGAGFTSMVVTAASFASAATLASVSAATLALASTATLASIFAAFFASIFAATLASVTLVASVAANRATRRCGDCGGSCSPFFTSTSSSAAGAIVAEACTCTRPLRSPPKLSSRSRWGSIPSDAWSVSVSNAEVYMRCTCGANGPGMAGGKCEKCTNERADLLLKKCVLLLIPNTE